MGNQEALPIMSLPPLRIFLGPFQPGHPSFPRGVQKALARLDANGARFPGLKSHLKSIFIKGSDTFRCRDDGTLSEGITMT